MKITRETDYAIRCILHMSKQPDTLHMITDIAQQQDVPKSFLAKILQKLAKADIVVSTRGVKGGFTLSRKPSHITLLNIIEAVQGPLSVNICVMDNKSCPRNGVCSVHPIWVDIREFLNKKLGEYTFKQILSSVAVHPDKRSKVRPASLVRAGKCTKCGVVKKASTCA